MFDVHTVEIEWGGRPLTLESGKVARQADGSVIATYGETVVHATVVAMKEPKPGQDFFPLTVNYQEKTYAAGKIPGGFFKREGRPSEKETLTSRLIDRPIRPLFAEGFKCDTQVIVTVLQHDLENDPDIVAMVAASAALTLSGVPFLGPIGGARVGMIDGEFVLNPNVDEMPESKLDLVVAIEEERLTRVKHGLPKDVRALWPRFGGRFGYFPWASVSYCLDAAGLGIDDLDAIVLPEEAEATAMAEILPLKDRRKVIISNAPDGGAHHYRHALSAFLASPFERAAVLVVDGDGSVDGNGYEAESGYLFEDRRGASREVFSR